MTKPLNTKINKKRVIKRSSSTKLTKNVKLYRRNAKATIYLGGGFDRFEFTRFIPANTRFTFTFLGGSTPTISAGWSNSSRLPGVVLSFPQGNNWVIVIETPPNQSLTETFYFITKD